jgi:hypothetical protein
VVRPLQRQVDLVRLLKPDGITAMDRTAMHHGGINANVGLVVLGCRAQDARIPREIPLGQGGHHTARAGTGNAQANLIPDGQRVADPEFSIKAFSPTVDSITMLGRNRRTSKRPVG